MITQIKRLSTALNNQGKIELFNMPNKARKAMLSVISKTYGEKLTEYRNELASAELSLSSLSDRVRKNNPDKVAKYENDVAFFTATIAHYEAIQGKVTELFSFETFLILWELHASERKDKDSGEVFKVINAKSLETYVNGIIYGIESVTPAPQRETVELKADEVEQVADKVEA